jgi:hypothetical protein
LSYCTQCGHLAEPGRFCTQCGAELAELAERWRTDTSERAITAVIEPFDFELYADAPAADPVAVPATVPVAVPARVPAWLVRSGRHRFRGPWWLAAAAAVVLVCLVAWLLGRAITGGSDPATPPPSVAAGDVVDLTRGASAAAEHTARPSLDLSGDMVPYDAHNLLDGVESTAWRMAGDGSGNTLTVTLPSASVVTRVGLINGYAKVDDDVNWYPRNRRVLEVEWHFDDGTTVVQHLDETRRMQTIDVGPISTSTIRVKLMIVSPPGGRDYTAVSDLLIEGAPA